MKHLLILLVVVALYGCGGRDYRNPTAEEFKYKLDATAKNRYSDDTTAIRPILQKMLYEGIGLYKLEQYDKGTKLYIDSLLYGPDYSKMIVFVVDRNSTSKMSTKENDSTYYYNAYYFYATRDSLNGAITVYDRHAYGLINFYDKKEIGELLREYCFARMQGKDGDTQLYNIDDRRFWEEGSYDEVKKWAVGVKESDSVDIARPL